MVAEVGYQVAAAQTGDHPTPFHLPTLCPPKPGAHLAVAHVPVQAQLPLSVVTCTGNAAQAEGTAGNAGLAGNACGTLPALTNGVRGVEGGRKGSGFRVDLRNLETQKPKLRTGR